MSIDADKTYEITEKLSFPRLVGSEGEKKAVEIIIDEFKQAGYDKVHRETFKTSLANWILARYIFIPVGVFIMLLWFSFTLTPFFTLGLLVLLIVVAIKALGGLNSTEITLSKNEKYNWETDNLYTTLDSPNSKAKVVFMGHYDTKSQTFPSAVRISILMTAIVGDLILLFLYLILTIVGILAFIGITPVIDFTLFNTIMFYPCLILAIIGGLNYFNKTGNKSPGAYDNAGAVATVIELSRYFKQNPMENIDFIFLTPSSEELNLGGAKAFMKEHKGEFDPKTTYFINFDGIGGTGLIRLITAYGIPRKTSSKKLNDLLVKSADELDIDAKVIYFPTGAWSDFMPVIQLGYEACWLASGGGGLKYVHTTKDTMDLISKEGLKNGLLLTIEVVKKLNEEFN